MNRNIRLLIAYEGTKYNGWQRQSSNANTIQEKLESLLTRMCGEVITVNGSGRTDAGVHAKGQVVNFHTSCTMSEAEMLAYINQYLPLDIVALEAAEVSERFHARLNATKKTYCYRILNSCVRNVFERNFLYQIPEKLDVSAMKQAAGFVLGSHDFKSFCGNKRMNKTTVRELYDIRFETAGKEISIYFTGSGFLHHMVRILAGTLIEIGLGKKKPEDMKTILLAKDRAAAGMLAPAAGLCLQEVYYH